MPTTPRTTPAGRQDAIVLSGHSGCGLRVKEEQGALVTIKTSKDEAYNGRLRLQADKQKAYAEAFGRAPRVLEDRTTRGGLYEFDMEYISGTTLANHLRTAPLASLRTLAARLGELVRTDDARANPRAGTIFREKIASLEKAVGTGAHPAVRRAFAHLRKADWSACPESTCHGDLTLENILIREGDLYLIDFLDSFYDSWMIDMAKLLQDVECLWSYRHERPSRNLLLRALTLKRLLIAAIERRPDGAREMAMVYDVLLLNLLRILPYTKDEATLQYLHHEIGRLVLKVSAAKQ